MKEIIYLDTEIINSMLAQLDEGIVNSFTLENSNQETQGEEVQSTRGKDSKLKGDLTVSTGIFPGGSIRLGSDLGNSGLESEKYSTSILESQKDILNKAFHDYSLEILIKKLKEQNILINDNDDVSEGSLKLIESTFRFYDFELIKNSINPDAMEKIMKTEIINYDMTIQEARKLINKTNPTAKERDSLEIARKIVSVYDVTQPVINLYSQLNTFSKYASEMLPNQSIIKTDSYIGILKNKHLKESPEALVYRTDNSRQVKCLFRVIGKKHSVFNGLNLGEFTEQDIYKIPNLMLDIVLGSFDIIKKGDTFVTPIAIYFE